jgi:hypothetical protein
MPNFRRNGTYAGIYLSRHDEDAVREFLSYGWGIPHNQLTRRFHLTIYRAPIKLPALIPAVEQISIECDIAETRFMVMAPGGENPRPDIEPSRHRIGIRLTRRNAGLEEIHRLRQRLCWYETAEVVGTRRSSDRNYNAFGARYYQPHLTLLLPGTHIERDLREIGNAFRQHFQWVRFDTFRIELR